MYKIGRLLDTTLSRIIENGKLSNILSSSIKALLNIVIVILHFSVDLSESIRKLKSSK